MTTSAAEELASYTRARDCYHNVPANLQELQLEAARELFAQKRSTIPVLDRRANEMGVTEIGSLQDLVPLLFSHTNYKSYPEAFVDGKNWRGMTAWLGTLSSQDTSDISLEGVETIDDWLDNAKAAGHHIFASSGTSGKSSFIDQSTIERDLATEACCNAYDFSIGCPPVEKKYAIFTTMPTKSTHKMTHFTNVYFPRWEDPGHFYRLSNDPMTAYDAMRPAQLRRLLAAGKVGPAEVAEFEDEQERKQKQRAEEWEQWIDKIAELRHRPIQLASMWGATYRIVESLRARGIKPGDFHPDCLLMTGGGTKGVVVPNDFMQQIMEFFGFKENQVSNTYGMSEVNGLCAHILGTDSYAIPPWLIPLVLNKEGEVLQNPESGEGIVEGRMAFFDVTCDAHWGGIISGDKVTVEFGSDIQGIKTPIVHRIARYQDLEEGEDKLTCAGQVDAYVRGALSDNAVLA